MARHLMTVEIPDLVDELWRPRPEHVPLGPPHWDEFWDGRGQFQRYYHPNGRRCTMREFMYLYEPSDRTDRSVWRKQWRARRQVAQSFVGPCRVSTVFLMFDHSFSMFGEPTVPVLYETRAFERKRSYRPATENMPGYGFHEDIDEMCHRYSTREQALRGHWSIRKSVRRMLQLDHGPRGGWRG